MPTFYSAAKSGQEAKSYSGKEIKKNMIQARRMKLQAQAGLEKLKKD